MTIDELWERLAQDIHAHGNSVRDAIKKHRPDIEQAIAARTLDNLRELSAARSSQKGSA